MTSIMVVGGAGFVCGHVTKALAERGDHVIVYDLGATKGGAFERPYTASRPTHGLGNLQDVIDRIEVVRGDAHDYQKLVRTVRKYKIQKVVDAAYMGWDMENNIMQIDYNLKTIANLCEICRLENVGRFVYTSSGGVNGRIEYEPVDEDHPTLKWMDDPTIKYNYVYLVKTFCEQWGILAWRMWNVDFVALRIAAQYGPGVASVADYMSRMIDAAV
ncbi:MAG TPA: NAD-dependent epimerase/dehydratase family protein, partial [Candidatus Hodarchaeales archaeon]|nr:NAD-dependent epimerase/dehydratase family protein [Candidatus Hodarchaeales archaeon]